jgi:sec-independent protein translocase protein TatA
MFRNPTTDVIVLIVIVLLIFGPKRLPVLGRSLGQGMREFKDGITGHAKDSEAEERPEIAQTSATTPPAAPMANASQPETAEVPAQDRRA